MKLMRDFVYLCYPAKASALNGYQVFMRRRRDTDTVPFYHIPLNYVFDDLRCEMSG